MSDNVIVIFEVLFCQLIWLMMPTRRTQEILLMWKNIQLCFSRLIATDQIFSVSGWSMD
jgi:hypothetical protein